MKKIMILLLLCGIGRRGFAQDSLVNKINEVLTTYVRCGKFNGTALVAQKGKVLFEQGFGIRNLETTEKNDSNAIFRFLGSFGPAYQ